MALREQARAERDEAVAAEARASEERDQALALATDVERQCNEMRRSGRQLEERLAGLEGALREMKSWGV